MINDPLQRFTGENYTCVNR